jgi:threonine/homoserine/homoserine lactone efflux protein
MYERTCLKWISNTEIGPKGTFCKNLLHKLRGISIMENILGELWMFKLMSIAGAAYLVYFFIKDRRGKKD